MQQNIAKPYVDQKEKIQTNQQTNQDANNANKKISRRVKFLILTGVFGASYWAFTKYLEKDLDLAVSLKFSFLFYISIYETRYLN